MIFIYKWSLLGGDPSYYDDRVKNIIELIKDENKRRGVNTKNKHKKRKIDESYTKGVDKYITFYRI